MLTIQVRITKELVEKAQELVDKGLYSNKSEVVRDALRRLVFYDCLKTAEEKRFTVVFSADLHGNREQYGKLFNKAIEEKADALIIGGDIAPKDKEHRTIEAQKSFFKQELIPMITRFKKDCSREGHSCQVCLMMGNDDFKPNQSFLKSQEKKAGFVLIHNRCLRLHEKFSIIGYSYVPLTPFRYKDWEKLDLDKENEHFGGRYFVKEGIKTRNGGFFDFAFDLKKRDDTIEKDLRRLFNLAKDKKVVLVTHAPPSDTGLDVISAGAHVGSAAVRKIIEEKQPEVTLHGHIHETVDVSGRFKENLGESVCTSAGNNEKSSSLAVVTLNIYNPSAAKREII